MQLPNQLITAGFIVSDIFYAVTYAFIFLLLFGQNFVRRGLPETEVC